MTDTSYLEDRLSITISPIPAMEPPELEKGDPVIVKPLKETTNIDDLEVLPSVSNSSEKSTNSRNSSSSSTNNKRAKIHRLPSIARTAVRATKEQFWDSNEPGIIVAQTAVDRWEDVYVWFRNVVVASSQTMAGIYNASKAGARGLDKGLLVPVRDYIILPTFGIAEHVVGTTSSFIRSSEARIIQSTVLEGSSEFVAKAVPFGLGENVVLPAVRLGSGTVQKAWEVARYPVPSEKTVRDTVDFLLNGSKQNLSVAGHEIFWYFRRADANISRTLRRTQWAVLGSGPYETLDEAGRRDVMDHVCERYLSIGKDNDDDGGGGDDDDDDENEDSTSLWIARYEFMSNVRACNRSLYRDLVETGFLKERGGASSEEDEWLSEKPLYRKISTDLFLLEEDEENSSANALWFRLPSENGRRPKKDIPWVLFDQGEGQVLEEKYRSILNKKSLGERPESGENEQLWESPKYATEAKWYNPDLDRDVLLDQKRHAVTFVRSDGEKNEISQLSWEADRLFALPSPLLGLYRPTMWRSYGPNEIRRAVWFLDTPRNGPQPYGEDAQAVLEDAYQFLKWIIGSKQQRVEKPPDEDSENGDDSENLNVLLTVQVPSPDSSEQQLVQFSSLTTATAIGKGLGGAIALFKRRVYRGAQNVVPLDENDASTSEAKSGKKLDEDSRWTTTTEVALEKLRLTFSEDSVASKEFEESNVISIEDEEPSMHLSDVEEEEDDAIETSETLSTKKSDETSSTRSEPSQHEESLASHKVYTREKFANTHDNEREVEHLILVVHGIGEMMQAYDLFGLKKVPNIADCCSYLRANHAEISDAKVSQIAKEINKTKSGRVEYLPIEWHEAFSAQKARRTLADPVSSPSENRKQKVRVDDISLRTIPTLRSFANDTLMDILYFMSPAHHDIIVDIVTFELNFVAKRFRKLTGFKGDISIIGHSIGSVIAWDILDNQGNQGNTGFFTLSKTDDSYRYPQLNFKVETMFALGSPIPVFLMIRNQEKPLSTAFTLNGCTKVFNIFHPYDPVSYRIEPLIHPRNSEIDPEIMIHWNGGFRFQYQTKRIWDKIVDQTLRAEENVIHSLESGIEALGLVDSKRKENPNNSREYTDFDPNDQQHSLVTGSLNGGRRIDYMLQETEIDRANEYLAALAAHSCYWLEKDLSLFIANEISLEK
eukprot:CAMPEP_0116081600 /NCGR_PEP_ID=MMETSP0327-20121206/2281_1 /TAXON_ID=44447 /ORGANISM="Pseudo-nitzschia delicatissima, Strain B596" /LENGTH=1167 /DNA_ID=CAMNT_0003572341 /DNA_START=157 /DNA_END=3660 /DNA_ORIENTATION=-